MINIHKIFCVSLKRRTDRRAEIKEFCNRVDIKFEFFDAIDGKDICDQYDSKLKPAALGCLLSHKAILERARDEGMPNVMIIEDDLEARDSFQEESKKYLSSIPDDWDMVYLGGQHKTLPIKIAENVHRVTRVYGTHCILYRNTCYDKLISRIEQMKKPVDMYYADVIDEGLIAYCHVPYLTWQRKSYSDIVNKVVEYQAFKDL